MVGDRAPLAGTVEGLESPERRKDRETDGMEVFDGTLESSTLEGVQLRGIATHALTATVREEFMRTARAWNSMTTHPNVVGLIDFGSDPRPWVLVETEGEKISSLNPPLDVESVNEIVTDVAEALRTAQLYNHAHGDLCPEAIRVEQEDELRVMVDDWGLRRVAGTHHGKQYVTGYTAPEQLDGDWVDQLVDVYGLAGIAYFALTGHAPLSDSETILREQDPVPPLELSDDIPPAVSELVHDTLIAPPHERPETPHQFALRFEQAASGGGQPGPVGGATTATQEAGATEWEQPTSGSAAEQPPGQPTSRDDGRDVRRRTLLVAGGMLAALAAMGLGATVLTGSGGGGLGLSTVPARSQAVAAVDLAGIRERNAFRETLDEELSTSGGTPGSLAGVFDQVTAVTGIDPREVASGVVFGALKGGPSRYVGVVLDTSLSVTTVREGLRSSHETVTEQKYREQQVQVIRSSQLPWPLRVAPLGDGDIAVGTKPEVRDVIDVRRGSVDPVGGDVQSGFQSADEGGIRVGFVVPETIPAETPASGTLSQIGDLVRYGSGSVTFEETTSATISFEAPSADDAASLQSQMEFGVSIVSSPIGQEAVPDRYRSLYGVLRPLAIKTEISHAGTTVTLEISGLTDMAGPLYKVVSELY